MGHFFWDTLYKYESPNTQYRIQERNKQQFLQHFLPVMEIWRKVSFGIVKMICLFLLQFSRQKDFEATADNEEVAATKKLSRCNKQARKAR